MPLAAIAKSIIMIAFFLTMPISSRMPINPMTFSSLLKHKQGQQAPTPAEAAWRGS